MSVQEQPVEGGPTLHSFVVPNISKNNADNSADITDDGDNTIPEDQNDTQMDDADNEQENGGGEDEEDEDNGSVELLSREIVDETGVKRPKSPNSVNVINISEDDERGNGQGEEEDGEDSTSGTSVLPLSKIKKIFKTDPEHVSASEAAVFTTAIATELFIQYFTEQASLIARSEKRKKLQYKDFASSVSSIEQLHFLADTVPKTYNLKKLVENDKIKYAAREPKEVELAKGQTTLNFGPKKPAATKEDDDDELPESDDENDVGQDLDDFYEEYDDDDVLASRKGEDELEESDHEFEKSKDDNVIHKDKDLDVIMH